jgi:hypothetical protein
MKIKITWGTGIFIFLVIFFIAIFSFIIFAFQQNNDLVEDDYYPKEITYQDHIDKITRLEELGQEIILEKQDDQIVLNFPDTMSQEIIGGIHIYRPSDASMDLNLKIETDNQNRQFISTKSLSSGKYTIKVDWVHNGTGYYQELYYYK